MIFKHSLCTMFTHVAKRRISNLRDVMRVLPQPVVVVSSAMTDTAHGKVRRGVTCSSFTSLTLDPPTVLISVYNANIINSVIESSQHFAVNLLSDKQLKEGMRFAKGLSSDLSQDQFDDINYTDGAKGVPLLEGSIGSLQCHVTNLERIGDHNVWYGTVIKAIANEDTTLNPMLYYQRAFRSIGDEIFMQAFEDTTIPFEEWTHEAHLRMAWNYITQYGQERATPLVKNGIMKYNETNEDKIKFGYSETVTMFYIHVITKAVSSLPPHHTFEDFLHSNIHMTKSSFLSTYYSPNILSDPLSKHNFLKPDKSPLPQ